MAIDVQVEGRKRAANVMILRGLQRANIMIQKEGKEGYEGASGAEGATKGGKGAFVMTKRVTRGQVA